MKHYSLVCIFDDALFSCFKEKYACKEDDFLCYEVSPEESIIFLRSQSELENFFKLGVVGEVLRIICISFGKIHISSEIQAGDIVVPHTYIDKTGKALFVEYAPGDEFLLADISLHFSAICVDEFSEDPDAEFQGDIEEKQIYPVFYYLYSHGYKEKCVGFILTEKNTKSQEYMKNFLDIIISE